MHKPVRKIGMGTSSVRGIVQSRKNRREIHYESALERDLIYHLEFDNRVKEFTEQPVLVEYLEEQQIRTYVPDFLVIFYQQDCKEQEQTPLLIEVKYKDELRKKWSLLKPKFKAAVAYAKLKGWHFKIMTEVDIRTVMLDNIKLLWRHKHSSIDKTMLERLKQLFVDHKVLTPKQIWELSWRSENMRDEALYTLWCLVAQNYVETNLTQPLSMETKIWKYYDE